MLQRIQTVYLIGGALLTFLLFAPFFPLASVEGNLNDPPGEGVTMLSDGIFEVADHWLMIILTVTAGLMALAAVFQFKHRGRQIVWTRLVLISQMLFLVLASVLFYQEYVQLDASAFRFEIGYGVLLCVLVIVCCGLAIRAIRRDDRLVRSMDRLR